MTLFQIQGGALRSSQWRMHTRYNYGNSVTTMMNILKMAWHRTWFLLHHLDGLLGATLLSLTQLLAQVPHSPHLLKSLLKETGTKVVIIHLKAG